MINIFSIICIIFCTTAINGLRIGSYNTYQVFTNPIAPDLIPNQLQAILQSDIDIMCLQELFSPYSTTTYASSLSTVYPYSFSSLDIRSTADLTVPRTSCSADQIDAINDCAVCAAIYPDTSFTGCLATYCADAFSKLHLSECAWCYLFAPTLTGSDDIDVATAFCQNEHNLLLNQTDGTLIISKLPIINTWSVALPSFLFVEKRVNIAQIDICSETQQTQSASDSDERIDSCSDSLIVACTHLNPTGFKDPVSSFVPSDEAQQEAGLSSHIELNAYQIEYLLDNVLSDDIYTRDKNILGLIVAGDFNVGQTWFEDNFDIFEQYGYVEYGDGLCTVCLDPNDSDFNVLAVDEGNEGLFITDANSSRDLDHILVHEEGLKHVKRIKRKHFQRIFTDKYNISGGIIPLSDHWGIELLLRIKEDSGSASSDDAMTNDEAKQPNISMDKTVNSSENKYEWYLFAVLSLVLSMVVIVLIWMLYCTKLRHKIQWFTKRRFDYDVLKHVQVEGRET